MTRYAVALGSNLGDRLANLRTAVDEITRFSLHVEVSGLYETAPIGGREQDPYLNAVVVFQFDGDAYDLLARLQSIEIDQHRVREERWGPRTLDLDIITTDGPAIDDPPRLIIPHPRARQRRFVLLPLMDVWPDAEVAPGLEVGDAFASVAGQKVDRLQLDWVVPWKIDPGRWWVLGQFALFAFLTVMLVLDGSLIEDGFAPIQVVGLVAALAGLVVIGTSARALGSSLTVLPEPLVGGELRVLGPYRWVRHPMYTGVVLLFLGTALFVESVSAMVLALLLLAYFWFKADYEERQLRISYPGYGRYIESVGSRFIPFLL